MKAMKRLRIITVNSKCLLLLALLLANGSSLFSEGFDISSAEPIGISENSTSNADQFDDDPDYFKVKTENLLKEQKNSSVIISSNVTGASVYLNGNYQGNTPLTIKNLADGNYKLRIEKTHYETRQLTIRVRRGHEREYYIELKRITGRLSFTVTPGNATIQCDGITISSNPVTLDEGNHTVTVKCFGYNTSTYQVEVIRDMLRRVTVSLDEAQFAITSMSSSRASFNPRNAGSLGSNTINFSVTAPSSGMLTIHDSGGTLLASYNYGTFSTWDYSFTWDGRTPSGAYAPDGVFTATLEASGQSVSCTFTIDSSITYPQLSCTSDGTGLGSVASAQMYPDNTMMFGFGLGPSFNLSGGSLYGAPFCALFCYAPTRFLEFSLGYNIMLGALKTPSGYFTTKFGSSISLGNSTSFCYAFNARIGLAKDALYAPYGADIGTGLGTGIMLGIDNGFLYCGIASEFIYGPVKGMLTKGSDMSWKNGFILQVRSTRASFGMYASLNSCFGSYDFTTSEDLQRRTGDISSMIRVIDGGIQSSVYLSNSSVSAVFKAGTICYPEVLASEENGLYLYSMIGVSIVF